MILLIIVLFAPPNTEKISIQKFTTMEECLYFRADALKSHGTYTAECVDLGE